MNEFEVELDDEHIEYIRENQPVSIEVAPDMSVLMWIEYDPVADKEFLRMARDTSDD